MKTNKTTVYRQVDDLVLHGVLEEVQFGDGVMRYEVKLKDDHHHHVLCVGCGKVTDVVFEEDLKKHEKIIEKKTKFKILRHSLEFFGRCSRCESKVKRP
jgi:Fe2+ or Zn2+ uptake regulation protein